MKKFSETMTFNAGDIVTDGCDLYVVAQVGHSCFQLITLPCGNRFTDNTVGADAKQFNSMLGVSHLTIRAMKIMLGEEEDIEKWWKLDDSEIESIVTQINLQKTEIVDKIILNSLSKPLR